MSNTVQSTLGQACAAANRGTIGPGAAGSRGSGRPGRTWDDALQAAQGRPGASQPPPTSLLSERLGDGSASCLELATETAGPGDDLVFLNDDRTEAGGDANDAGHVLVRDRATGEVHDPSEPGETYANLDAWMAAHTTEGGRPAYSLDGAIASGLVHDVLSRPPEERQARIAALGDPALSALAGHLYADAPAAPSPEQADALRTVATNWDALREGDGSFSRTDLEAIAGNAPPAWAGEAMKSAARLLLRDDKFLGQLDTAAEGGDPDGKVSDKDLGAAMRSVPLTEQDTAALDSVARNWDVLRGGDDSVGRGDLEDLAGDDPPDGATDEMKATARYLLDHPDLLTFRLDVAAEGGAPDGKASIHDLGALLRQTPLTPEGEAAIRTVAANWDAVREGDDKLGTGDLEDIAGDDPPDYVTPEIKSAAQYLLAHPEVLKYRLDIAADGGKPNDALGSADLSAIMRQFTPSAEDAKAIRAVNASWFHLVDGDGNVTKETLEKLASGEYAVLAPDQGGTELKDAAAYLLAHPDVLSFRLDTAEKGGKPDGRISAGDIAAAMGTLPARPADGPADPATNLALSGAQDAEATGFNALSLLEEAAGANNTEFGSDFLRDPAAGWAAASPAVKQGYEQAAWAFVGAHLGIAKGSVPVGDALGLFNNAVLSEQGLGHSSAGTPEVLTLPAGVGEEATALYSTVHDTLADPADKARYKALVTKDGAWTEEEAQEYESLTQKAAELDLPAYGADGALRPDIQTRSAQLALRLRGEPAGTDAEAVQAFNAHLAQAETDENLAAANAGNLTGIGQDVGGEQSLTAPEAAAERGELLAARAEIAELKASLAAPGQGAGALDATRGRIGELTARVEYAVARLDRFATDNRLAKGSLTGATLDAKAAGLLDGTVPAAVVRPALTAPAPVSLAAYTPAELGTKGQSALQALQLAEGRNQLPGVDLADPSKPDPNSKLLYAVLTSGDPQAALAQVPGFAKAYTEAAQVFAARQGWNVSDAEAVSRFTEALRSDAGFETSAHGVDDQWIELSVPQDKQFTAFYSVARQLYWQDKFDASKAGGATDAAATTAADDATKALDQKVSDAKVKKEGTPSPDGVDISYSSGKPDAYKEVLQTLQATFNKANAEWKPEYDASGKLVTARPVDRVAQFAETWNFNASSQTLERPASAVSDLAARQDWAKLQHPDLGTIESKNPSWVNVLGNIFTLGIYGLTYSALEKGRQQPLVDWQSGALEARGRATGTADMKTEELNLAIADAGLGVALGVVGLGAGLLEEGLAAAGAEASRLGAGGAVGEIGEIEGFTAAQAGEQLTEAGVFRADGNLGAITPGADPAAFDPASWYAGLEAKPLAGGAAEKVWTDPATGQELLVLEKPGVAADGTTRTDYVLAKADGAEVRLYDPQTRQAGPALTRTEGGWDIVDPAPAGEAQAIDAPADVREAAAADGFTASTIGKETWSKGAPMGPRGLGIRSVMVDGKEVQYALVDGEYTAVKPRYAGSQRFYQLYDPRTDQSWGDLFVADGSGGPKLMASRPGFDGRLRGGARDGEADPLLANPNVGVPRDAPRGQMGAMAEIRRFVWNPSRQPVEEYTLGGNGLATSRTGPTIELTGAGNPARPGLAGSESLSQQGFEAGGVATRGADGSWETALNLDGITDTATRRSLEAALGRMTDGRLDAVGASEILPTRTNEVYRLIRTDENQIVLAKPMTFNGREVPNCYAVLDSSGQAAGRQFYVGPTRQGAEVADKAVPFEELSARAQQQLLTGNGRVRLDNGLDVNLNDYGWRNDVTARENEMIANSPAVTDKYDIPNADGTYDRATIRRREELLDRSEKEAKLAVIGNPTQANVSALQNVNTNTNWFSAAQGTARANRLIADNATDVRATSAKKATVASGIAIAIGTAALIGAGIYARNLANRPQSGGGGPAGTPASPDTYQIPAGSAAPITADVLANDQAGLTVQSARITAGQGAVAVVNNQVAYTPPAGGLAPGAAVTVEYVAVDAQGTRSPATLTINADPRTTLPDTAAIPAGSAMPRPINVLANDPQAALTLTGGQVVSGGGTVAVQDGQLVYTPPAGGLPPGAVATLSYTAEDPQGRTYFDTVQVRANP